jgi:hypothetical protein
LAKVSARPVEAVTASGCGVLLSTTGLELSCNGAQVVVAPAPPDTSPGVLSAASFVDQGSVLVGASHGLWVFPLRP